MTSTPNPGSRAIQFEQDAPVPSGFWSMAMLFWLATLFILYSKFFDEILMGFYIPKMVLILTGVFYLVSGRPLFFLRSTGGQIMTCLVLWVTFTMFFSIWKGGSLPSYSALLLCLFFFAAAASLPNSITDVRKSLYTLGFSGVVAALLSFRFGMDRDGRLALHDGSYHDPNYFAMALAAAVPLLWQMGMSTKSKIVKVSAWLGVPVLLLVFGKTGSRGGMMGFAVMMVILLIISSVKTKIVLVLATAVGMVIALATLPGYVRERYLTLFSVDTAAENQSNGGNADLDRLQADVGSSQERKHLLMESVNLTFEHPLVGVGPGNFQAAVFNEATAVGLKHNEWMQTHNSYTEISCETGIPGLILLLCLIGSSFRDVSVVLKGSSPRGEKPDPVTYATAKALLLSLTVIMVCVFFLAVGYDFAIYVWAGLTVGLRRVYEQKTVASAVVEEQEAARPTKPAFAPAYAKVQDRLAQPASFAVSGKPVRFNRFR